ncbi:hypothetical protein ACFQ4O_03325 [Methylopila musalis]|uniref:Uncharacterized protein n=1 Tax=Methylopila musalis TaxID=1134781 RepID=A0ABW3Z508_9HYPH
MANPAFKLLNEGWNADPVSPMPEVEVDGAAVHLKLFLNYYAYAAAEDEACRLTFLNCSAWRLGRTNDEGWYRGQCRYTGVAPKWGEFFEIIGPDHRRTWPDDWKVLTSVSTFDRHFLFYLKDNTFECFAKDWSFERGLERTIVI